MSNDKKEIKSCSLCKHKKAMPLNHPCKKCHGNSRWAKMTDKQWKLHNKVQESLSKTVTSESGNFQSVKLG